MLVEAIPWSSLHCMDTGAGGHLSLAFLLVHGSAKQPTKQIIRAHPSSLSCNLECRISALWAHIKIFGFIPLYVFSTISPYQWYPFSHMFSGFLGV